MSHMISFANARNEMAYRGEKPWHGLGQELTDGASIDEWREQAGMNWTIRRSKVRYAASPTPALEDFRSVEDRHVLLRSDNLQHLSIVSDSFKIVQPSEVLEFFRDLTEAAGFKMETAGVLHQGRKFWALARIGEESAIVGHDLVRAYLMLATSCDGSIKTSASNVATRLVCENTMRVAMGEKGNSKIQVSHRSVFNADAVKRQLGVCVPAFHRFVADMRELAKRDVSPIEAERYMAGMVEVEDVEKAREVSAFGKMMALFNGQGIGSQLPGVRGTAWGLLNAVTEHVDHHARARSQSNRLDSAWFGDGEETKQRAHDAAMKLAA